MARLQPGAAKELGVNRNDDGAERHQHRFVIEKIPSCCQTTMGFYENQILLYLIHLAMRQTNFAVYRRRVVPAAESRMLEIGIGSGLNLPFYRQGVKHLIRLDPARKLLSFAQDAGRGTVPSMKLLEGSAEAIPLPSQASTRS